MSVRIIPDVVINTQIAASDPATSAWVAANAGSGKTPVSYTHLTLPTILRV